MQRSMSKIPSALRLAIVSAGILVGQAAFAAPAALAAQTILIAASPSPTVDGVPTTITATGSSDTGGSVYVSVDPAGTACANNPSNDNGAMVISGDGVQGPAYSDTGTITPSAQNYSLCAWLMPAGDDGSGTPLAGPASTPLSVSSLQATVTLSAPSSVSYQQNMPVSIKWQADATGSLLVNVLPTSYGPCTADPSDEPQYVGWLTGQNGYTNHDPIGDAATTGTNRYVAHELAPDTYQVCAWIEESSGTVVAGPVAVDIHMQPLPGSRTFSGRTAQGLPVAVTLNGYDLQDIVYSARFHCGTPEYFATGLRWNGIWNDNVLTAANFGTLQLVGGRFSAHLDANPANRFNLSGTLRGSVLSGSLNALMRLGPPRFSRPATCRTGKIRFTIGMAHPARRRPRPRHRPRR